MFTYQRKPREFRHVVCCLDDCVHPRRGKKLSIKILHRFHFSSALKRMATVCNVLSGTGSGQHIAVVKGAAEVIRPMVEWQLLRGDWTYVTKYQKKLPISVHQYQC